MPWMFPCVTSLAYTTMSVGGAAVVNDQTGPDAVPASLRATICQKYVVPAGGGGGASEGDVVAGCAGATPGERRGRADSRRPVGRRRRRRRRRRLRGGDGCERPDR